MSQFKTIFSQFSHLFFPQVCEGCGKTMQKSSALLCGICVANLPLTGYANLKNNPTQKKLEGRLQFNHIAGVYYFNTEGLVQELVHQLKYKNQSALGIAMGKWMGIAIKNNSFYAAINYIIPVPLHPKKMQKRGYNQALLLAEGIKEELGVPIFKDLLIKTIHTQSQTKLSTHDRWKNVSNIFHIQNAVALEGKHILLIDDVITTGATIEACGKLINQIPNTTLSILSFAVVE